MKQRIHGARYKEQIAKTGVGILHEHVPLEANPEGL